MSSVKKTTAAVGGITVLALAIRLWVVLKYGPLWSDEMFSFVYSQKPWLANLKLWAMETNPPLHMLMLKIWFYVFPATEFFARLPSVIIGTASVAAIYRLSRLLFNRRVAYLSAILLALHPYHIFWSATARAYALLILLAILSVHYLYLIFFAGEKTKKNYLLLLVVNTCLLYTHLTALPLIMGQAVILFILKKEEVAGWLKMICASLLGWLAWAAPAVYFKLINPYFGYAWFLKINHTRENLLGAVAPLFTGTAPKVYAFILISLFIPAVIGVFWRQIRRGEPRASFIFIFTLAFIPVAAALLLGTWNAKFFLPALPFIVITFACLIRHYELARPLALLFMLVITIPGIIYLWQTLPINDWRIVNQYVSSVHSPERRQVLIYTKFSDFWHVSRYYRAPPPALSYYPFPQSSNFDEELIKKNYAHFIRPENDLADWARQMRLENYQDIFLLRRTNDGIYLHQTLEKQGWKKTTVTYPRLLEYNELIHYVRP